MYLEPGFGGMLLQILVAIAAAGGVLVFSLRKKIAGLFSKNKRKVPTADDGGVDSAADGAVDDAASPDVIDMIEDEKAATGEEIPAGEE